MGAAKKTRGFRDHEHDPGESDQRQGDRREAFAPRRTGQVTRDGVAMPPRKGEINSIPVHFALMIRQSTIAY